MFPVFLAFYLLPLWELNWVYLLGKGDQENLVYIERIFRLTVKNSNGNKTSW